MSDAKAAPPGWRLAAHVAIDPPPEGWRDALAQRLGQRPRRIGLWAELALYGACECLDAAGEAALPPGARVRIASLTGARSATQASMDPFRAGLLPLPFDFMQSQPALMLAALGSALDWQGDASFMVCRDADIWQRLALQGPGAAGALLGRVEERGEALATEWWRWMPA